ncbi:MAG: hypothetical protein K1Y36_12090 [Blastocatellia bacterium]|nr:hypothetical protein [Blastocatellia bacterium]
MSPAPESGTNHAPNAAHRQALNPTFFDYSGKPAPAHYGNPAEEYAALRQTVGMADLSLHGRLEISGKERTQFLNGMVSNYVKPLVAGCGLPALFLTAQGKVIADTHLYAVAESFWLDYDVAVHEKLWKKLFALTYAGDFKVADRTKTHGLISLQGPQAAQLFAVASGTRLETLTTTLTVEKVGGGTETIPVLPVVAATMAGTDILAVRRNRFGVDGWDVYVPLPGFDSVWNHLETAGAAFGLQVVGWQALETVRIETGIPRYGVDVDETVIAPEAGFETALSYHKGCYVGQETVAKIHWRGHDQVARKLTRLTVTGETLPPSGTPVLKGEKEVGHITSAVYSPQFGTVLALGYVRSSALQAGAELSVKLDETVCTVTPMA